MSDDANQVVTALAIVRSATGRELRGDAPVTTQTLAEYQPAPEDVEAVRAGFESAGFQVGPAVGVAMSLAASRSTFEGFFMVSVATADDGGYIAVSDGRGDRELPLSALPDSLARRVAAVTFEQPAQLFGPGEAQPWV